MLLLLAAGGCFQSCRQDDFEETIPDKEMLIAQGRYLSARGTGAAAESSDKAQPFDVGTPYRLLAFTKQYDPSLPNDKTPAAFPRFNKVAWEGRTSGGLQFINIDHPDKWFGFAALETEPMDELVSLDFYGFTYGRKEDNGPQPDYIELDGLPEETTPAKGSLASLKHTESVSKDLTTLKDLLHGKLSNQNIATAGKDSPSATQSILPFSHSFSKLEFFVGQQSEEEPDENGNRIPCFPGIQIEKVEVTNTYGSGSVYMQDGKVELLGDPIDRPLRFNEEYEGAVTPQEVAMGEMIVFPSDGAALKNEDKADGGYSVGLNITVKGPNRADIAQFLANTDSPAEIEPTTAEDGTTYYRGTVVKTSIIDNYLDKDIRFKQNTRYRLVILFTKGAVRIITVIPQVEEWLPGEGSETDPWQEQHMGQPQMFDNIVWSDRNLGADHYDPLGEDFEATIGYFYQSGRNIPYYPFDSESEKYFDKTTKTFTSYPAPEDKKTSVLANVKPYASTRHRFYPMVDPVILTMVHMIDDRSHWGETIGPKGDDRTWMMESGWGYKPQMEIPETKPTDACFDFMRSRWDQGSGLRDYDKRWDLGPQNQPVAGIWTIPTSRQFMAIFPSTPHAGNITFRAGGNNTRPMSWGSDTNDMDPEWYKTLRVTVPYYYDKMEAPARSADKLTANYLKAWNTLKEHGDPGTTKTKAYYSGSPGTQDNVDVEPEGDPEDGYASVYVISRNPDSKNGLPDELQNDSRFYIKEWGTIYAIKRAYTAQAYRMRWRVKCAGVFGDEKNPGLYVEVCRYRYNTDSGIMLTEDNYLTDFDWDHPAATLYFPICGLGDWTGNYINFGTECQYATSDQIDPYGGTLTSALQIKVTGDNAYNAYIAIIPRQAVNRDFGKQIRPIRGGDTGD